MFNGSSSSLFVSVAVALEILNLIVFEYLFSEGWIVNHIEIHLVGKYNASLGFTVLLQYP